MSKSHILVQINFYAIVHKTKTLHTRYTVSQEGQIVGFQRIVLELCFFFGKPKTQTQDFSIQTTPYSSTNKKTFFYWEKKYTKNKRYPLKEGMIYKKNSNHKFKSFKSYW